MKVKRVLSLNAIDRERVPSQKNARATRKSPFLWPPRGDRDRERDREWKERERERERKRFFPHSSLFPLWIFTHKERAVGMHKNLTPTRSFLSVFTLQMHKKRSPTEWVVYTNVSCTFPREDLCEYNALALSLLLLNGVCVCLCGPKSCFFSPLSPFVDLMTSSSTKQLQRRSQKIKKKRDRSLSFSLFHEKALFEVRDAFSLLLEIVESKKKSGKKSKTFARNVYQRARARRKREKKRRPNSNESNFFLLHGAFCLCFSRSREGEEETSRGGLREREGNGSLSYSKLRWERDKKKVTTNFLSSVRRARAQKRDRKQRKNERAPDEGNTFSFPHKLGIWKCCARHRERVAIAFSLVLRVNSDDYPPF